MLALPYYISWSLSASSAVQDSGGPENDFNVVIGMTMFL
jgi:hypothetical protein